MTEKQAAAAAQGTDLLYTADISLEEAFVGKDITVQLLRRVPCTACHGLGGATFNKCPRCGGMGIVSMETQLSNEKHPGWTGTANDGYCHSRHQHSSAAPTDDERRDSGCDGDRVPQNATLKHRVICAKCSGTGEVPEIFGSAQAQPDVVSGLDPTTTMSHAYHAADPSGPCKVCAGERFVETSERGTVRIPPGAFDGYSEVFPGKGNVDMADLITRRGGHDREKHLAKTKIGDFRVTVHVLPHGRFSREGHDLLIKVSITLAEALNGFSREIELLDGSFVTLRTSTATLPGTLLRVPRGGMPLLSSPKPPREHHSPATRGHGFAVVTSDNGNVLAEVVDTAAGNARTDPLGTREEGRFGDLFVKASVELPSGLLDDRSMFFRSVLGRPSHQGTNEGTA